ncbi:sialate O-acetylesterase [Aeoliella mucimassa]|uniref:Sialate O-acetylesterase domain-containing protein n=1 Tax=Aeoliella mucimassa TaxID=2527972 RepID=A0A518APQ0_9BACT|nr:sialate O-acetylesterase [Aeoliella mucimassa]QDU56694.1 hypothetical protein Pan181_29040 [Aeoliella mucimassa]
MGIETEQNTQQYMTIPSWKRAIAIATMVMAISVAAIDLSVAERIHVFLVGGQSNADGRAPISGLPAELQGQQLDVPFYWGEAAANGVTNTDDIELNYAFLRPGSSRTGGFGPEVTFGRAMADYYAARGEKVALIKHAQGGTTLSSDWLAGGNGTTTDDGGVYQVFQYVVATGFAEIQNGLPGQDTGPAPRLVAPSLLAAESAEEQIEISLDGMIWMQGESDAVADASLAYEDNLRDFISDVRTTYGADLPIVIGQLSSNQTSLNSTYREQIRAAQAAVAFSEPKTALVYTDDFALQGDFLHFSATGQHDLGYAFATAMQPLVVPEPSGVALAIPTMVLARWMRGQGRNHTTAACGRTRTEELP